MKVNILLADDTINLELKNKRIVIDRSSFQGNYRMSENLPVCLDELLKRNHLNPSDIERISLKSDMPKSYTAYRIASATVRAFLWGVEYEKSRSS